MFNRLKTELEEAAFMLADKANAKDIHSKLVNSIVLVEQLKNTYEKPSSAIVDNDEVRKVTRRLGLWSQPGRQAQVNAQILNAYLELDAAGASVITEEDISEKLGLGAIFWNNFSGMKAIGEKNHGKVFEVKGGVVTIWPPVKSAVETYKRRVFGS